MRYLTRRYEALLVFMLVFLCPSVASAQVQKLDTLSFAVPEGWKYEYKSGDDHAAMAWTNIDGAYCVIVITKPVPSSGNVDMDFAMTWRQRVNRNPQAGLPNPLYDIRGLGYSGKYSGAPLDNRTKHVNLYVLETGRSFVPVQVIAPNLAVLGVREQTIQAVLGSLRVAPLVAVPIKSTVNAADLVGDWKAGDASVVSYVNSTAGSYAGTFTTFSGEFYTVTSDGRYSHSFQGMTSGHIVREKSAGVVEFGGEFIVFHEQPGNKLTRYHFIAYAQGLGGGTLLTLLPDSYPVTSSTIAMYAQRFAREPAKK